MSQTSGWEEVACPLCGARRERELLRLPSAEGQPYRLVECAACSLGYLNPRPDPASIGRYYPDDYPVYHTGREKAARRSQPAVDSFTAIPLVGERRLLDVGCGSGWFAARMRALGWQVTGLDFSQFAAKQATEKYGIPTLVGSLPHADIVPESFDTITVGMVLEHVHDPHALIGAAKAALRPGGQLALAVPNFASLGRKLFGTAWFGLDLPRHLLHFTQPTLCRLVQEHGLRVVQTRLVPRRSWLLRSAAASSTWLGRLARFKPFASLLARWSAWTGRADSLMILAQKV